MLKLNKLHGATVIKMEAKKSQYFIKNSQHPELVDKTII